MSGRQPDMNLTAYDTTRKVGKQVGVGWTNDDGSIALALDPGTALVYGTGVVYRLFPKDRVTDVPLASETARPHSSMQGERARREYARPSTSPTNSKAYRPATQRGFDDMDDDIPF